MLRGTLWGIGVGPGDPELLTLKGKRLLEECDVIACPGEKGEGVALEIVQSYIQDKPVLECSLPMSRDSEVLDRAHEQAADSICGILDQGKTVAFITLGDPSIYSTYAYIHRRVLDRGYDARLVPGVPSFCAAAASLNQPLCGGGEVLHILPASHENIGEALRLKGPKVLMKAGKKLRQVLEYLRQQGQLEQASLVSRCGMDEEQVCRNLGGKIPSQEYLSIILVKGENAL